MVIVQKLSCLLFLLFFAPLLLVLWGIVKLSSRGPALYCSKRLGYRRKMILIWKFRTMQTDVPCAVRQAIKQSPEWLTGQKDPNDLRVTPVGHWMRHFSLDEIPQVFNVLNGTMNWIGPRPIIPAEDVKYGRYSDKIHSVKPGLTGLWQVSGRNLLTYHRRIAINLYYVRHRTWKLDLWILWKTVGAVFSGRGAY